MRALFSRVVRSVSTVRLHGAFARRATLACAAVVALSATGAAVAQAALPVSPCASANVVAKVLPAVVNITAVRVLPAQAQPENQDPKDQDSDKPSQEQFEVFVGSGYVIDPSGVIVTNRHVIQNAAFIRVTFNDRAQVSAQLIAAASKMDVALLQVRMPAPLASLRFGNSDELRLGQPVIAIGNPIGLGTSVSSGVISGLDRNLMRTPFDDFIQTDASINPGNSGGPLLDCAGDVIGMDTALYSNNKAAGSIGLGFALPSNDVSFVADILRNPTFYPRDWIGVHLQGLTQPLTYIFGRPDMSGAIVTGIDPDGPAANAAIVPGDIVTGVDGKPLPDARAILRTIVFKPAGTPVTLTLWRQDREAHVTIVGRAWPQVRARRGDVLASAADVARAEAHGPGMSLAPLPAADRQRLELKNGVGVLVKQVAPGTRAAEMGLQPGDVIEQVDHRPAKSPADVMEQLTTPNPSHHEYVALLVHSKATTKWVTLYVGRIDVADLLATPALPHGGTTTQNAAAAMPQSQAPRQPGSSVAH